MREHPRSERLRRDGRTETGMQAWPCLGKPLLRGLPASYRIKGRRTSDPTLDPQGSVLVVVLKLAAE